MAFIIVAYKTDVLKHYEEEYQIFTVPVIEFKSSNPNSTMKSIFYFSPQISATALTG